MTSHRIRSIVLVLCIAGALVPLVASWRRTLPPRFSEKTLASRREQIGMSFEERVEHTLGPADAELFHRLRRVTPENAMIALYLPVRQHNLTRVRRLLNVLYPRHATYWAQLAPYFLEHPEELGPHCFVVNFAKDKTFPTQEFFERIAETEAYILWRYKGAS